MSAVLKSEKLPNSIMMFLLMTTWTIVFYRKKYNKCRLIKLWRICITTYTIYCLFYMITLLIGF